ncbi:MAG TPA: DoxX family protein [Planctomycetota bacterium]|nr:DoxX family protein [Planctomycetota bacterium]
MVRIVLRWLLAAFMIFAGVWHFVVPEKFARIVPSFLPYPFALVYISGVFEILGGLGLLIPQTRRAASWGLIALYIAVFPANINMAVNELPLGDTVYPIGNWVRLPFQFVFIAWAWWVGKDGNSECGVRNSE